jgi:HEAT repeat protein
LVQEIAGAFGEIDAPASRTQLLALLSHPSFLVRKEAVLALG